MILKGRIESEERKFWSKVLVVEPDKCWEWQDSVLNTGYAQFLMHTSRDGHRKIYAHRYAYFLTHGELPAEGLLVCHHCDNRKCVNPAHLYAGTHVDNAQDKVKRGRCNAPRGNRQPHAVLTPERIVQVRELRAQGLLHKEIAVIVGVQRRQIGRVLDGTRWSHVA